MMRVLLVEDDERTAEAVIKSLTAAGYVVDHESNGEEAWFRGDTEPYVAVILDLGLPGMDGLSILRKWREAGQTVPVLILTARGNWNERVEGIDAGADDYLPKPFEPRELVARIQAVLKRSARATQDDETLHFGQLIIDTRLREVHLDDNPLNFTAMEYQLLELLARHAGETLSRDDILNHLKGIDADVYSRSVDILISRVRHKLRPGEFIKTVRNSGYCFVGRTS